MKILLLSDVHSNIRALDAVLEAEKDSDRIYCTGDLVDIGFHPREVIDRVRERGVICVLGNHDQIVIDRFEAGWNADLPPENFADLNARQLSAEAIHYLKNLPRRLYFDHDGVAYLLEHLYSGYELIQTMAEYDAFWGGAPVAPDVRHRAILLGHTHNPGILWLRDNACWINPGSVGYNRPQDPEISTRYVTITDGRACIHNLNHPHCRSRRAIGDEFRRRFGKL